MFKNNDGLRVPAWGYAAIITIAGLLVWAVSALFEPLTDDERQRMQVEQTRDLPQDR